MTDNHCPTCVFFEPMDGTKRSHGLCRINPPMVIPRVESTTNTPVTVITKAHTSFPYVRESDWCGKHELDTTQ